MVVVFIGLLYCSVLIFVFNNKLIIFILCRGMFDIVIGVRFIILMIKLVFNIKYLIFYRF